MKIKRKAGFMHLDYVFYFEPKDGILTTEEFTKEILCWAEREKKNVEIVMEGMEPVIRIGQEEYICRLGEPDVASQNHSLWKALGFRGINHSVGKFLGYPWVYVYRYEGQAVSAEGEK